MKAEVEKGVMDVGERGRGKSRRRKTREGGRGGRRYCWQQQFSSTELTPSFPTPKAGHLLEHRPRWAADIWGEGDICPPPERWWWWWLLWVGWGRQQGVCGGGGVGRGCVGNSIVHRPNIDIL